VLDEIIARKRRPMTRPEYAATFGARRQDIDAVRQFAKSCGCRVSDVSSAKRLVYFSGSAVRVAKAFRVHRVRYRMGTTVWESFTGAIYLPSALSGIVVGVLGFDSHPDFRRHGGVDMSAEAAATTITYTAPEVGKLYEFPDELDGRGQSIGVIALGGGYLTSDFRAYFRTLRLRVPKIRARSVAGARNAPRGAAAQFDGEVTGDIETVGAIAPRAKITVYFAPNSSRGFFEAVVAAVHDREAGNSVISISWGQAEVHFLRDTVRAFNEVLLEAAVLGVTVCCSSGDYGAFADTRDRDPHVNFPASSPFALACGGTTLVGRNARIESERVWHGDGGASGGGVSVVFPIPGWQRKCRVPVSSTGRAGRGVPDVAANADPRTGYRFFAHGGWHVGAGTSAAAPLWAGLIARINQGCGFPVGLLTPFLYGKFADHMRVGAIVPVTHGTNGLFRARRGWSACTGVGSPRGAKLVQACRRHFR
jgi:kumamolisin